MYVCRTCRASWMREMHWKIDSTARGTRPRCCGSPNIVYVLPVPVCPSRIYIRRSTHAHKPNGTIQGTRTHRTHTQQKHPTHTHTPYTHTPNRSIQHTRTSVCTCHRGVQRINISRTTHHPIISMVIASEREREREREGQREREREKEGKGT